MDKRTMIYAPLVGRRLQRIEEARNGSLYFHFTTGTVEVTGGAAIWHTFTPHPIKQEPLVIPAKESSGK